MPALQRSAPHHAPDVRYCPVYPRGPAQRSPTCPLTATNGQVRRSRRVSARLAYRNLRTAALQRPMRHPVRPAVGRNRPLHGGFSLEADVLALLKISRNIPRLKVWVNFRDDKSTRPSLAHIA